MAERLVENLSLDGGSPFLIYFGDFINDVFCEKNYACSNIGIALWRFLRQKQYQRIVFYEGANRLFCYDEQSLRLCRINNSVQDDSAGQTRHPSNKLSGGPLGRRNLIKERPRPIQNSASPNLPEAQLTQTENPSSARPHRGTSDTAALEILNHILIRDSSAISTALIFPHANDLDRQNLGGQFTFRELTNRMVQWAQAITPQPNVCIFVFQDTTRNSLLDCCRRQQLTAVSNFIESQNDGSSYVREVGPPCDAEILRVIHRSRLKHHTQVDWALLPHIAGLLARQRIRMRDLWRKLEDTDRLARETLLEWSRKRFINVKEHIIQHLGATMQAVDTTLLLQKLSPVLGQQDNIELVVREVGNWLSTPQKSRPLSLFLAGTSGVGKTYTVKLLAEALQNCGFDFCDFQMTEFSEEHRVSSLIGSPPGYVGSENEPALFLSLKQSNRLVILFDEIEKAHNKVLMALLQLVDEGKLSWNRGTGDFRECILCFTSNQQMQEMVDLKDAEKKAGRQMEGVDFQNRIRDILVRANVAPEVCGRINRFLIYNPLSLETTVQITGQQVQRLAKEYGLEVQEIHPDFLAETALASSGSPYGARPILNHVRHSLGKIMIAWLRDHPHRTRIRIEKRESGEYAVEQAIDDDTFYSSNEYDAALQACRRLQRQERILDKDYLREYLGQVYCQEDEIELLLRELTTWFGQARKLRPLSLFFVGTSGVGKTYTCELLAEAMQSRGYAYAYFAMSEFTQESHVANLIGSATGFVSSETTPKLFAALERSNQLVIVFDEIEKAHRVIFQTLMQLLDKGTLSWSKKEGDFRECIICFTSNARMSEMVALKTSFLDTKRNTDSVEFQNDVRKILTREGIAPEICGRITRFLVYNPLTPTAVFRIAFSEMKKIASRYDLELTTCPPETLADIAFSASGSLYGARPIAQRVENLLGPLLMEFHNRCPDVSQINYQIGDGGEEIVATNGTSGSPALEELMGDAEEHYSGIKRRMSLLDAELLKCSLQKVRCQEDNIRQMIDMVAMWYSQPHKKRPLSFFLAGVSGVGKTYTTQLLAEALRIYGFNHVYFAMNEFSQEFQVTSLLGSPAGYVGSEDTPRLFSERERSSRLVIVFDEIEKAHGTIFKALMQLLEMGYLSYSKGDGDFRECIIFFTSNAQVEELMALKQSALKAGSKLESASFQNQIRDVLVHAHIAPEICGRIDGFFIYNPLDIHAAVDIAAQEIESLAGSYGFRVASIDPALLAETAYQTVGSRFGARPIKFHVKNGILQKGQKVVYTFCRRFF